jgi:hypothetical protein
MPGKRRIDVAPLDSARTILLPETPPTHTSAARLSWRKRRPRLHENSWHEGKSWVTSSTAPNTPDPRRDASPAGERCLVRYDRRPMARRCSLLHSLAKPHAVQYLGSPGRGNAR